MTAYAFTSLSSPFPYEDGLSPNGINNSGQIVWDGSGGYGLNIGYVFTNGSYTQIFAPPYGENFVYGSAADGINNVGQIVGYYQAFSYEHGYLYSGGALTLIDNPFAPTTYNGVTTYLTGINDAGIIVGNYGVGTNDLPNGFVDDAGAFTALNDPWRVF
jgi:probable HAF family extracellular repeat protein